MDFKQKYLKYKKKYLEYKNNQFGGKKKKYIFEYFNFGSKGKKGGLFNLPSSIIQLSNSNLAVTDTLNNRVQICDLLGNYLYHFGSKGSDTGQFHRPSSIIQLSNSNLAVCDVRNNRVQIFDLSGNYLYHFGSKGSEAGKLNSPVCITQLRNNNMAVCDNDNNRVQIFDLLGNYLYHFDSRGTLRNPTGIIQLRNNNIAVCDTDNNRVQIFDLLGNYLYHFDSSDSENKLNIPLGITQLSNDDIAVSNTGNNIINIFDHSGNYITNISSKTRQIFNFPTGITTLSDGELIVCDTNNNNIKFFDLTNYYINRVIKNIEYNLDEVQPAIMIYFKKNDIDEGKTFTFFLEETPNAVEIPNISEISSDVDRERIPSDVDRERIPSDVDRERIPSDSTIEEIPYYIDRKGRPYAVEEVITYVNVLEDKIDFKGIKRKVIKQKKIKKKEINVFYRLFQEKDTLLFPNSRPNFYFENYNTYKKDSGIDAGALTRTVFNELSLYLSERYFTKDDITQLYGLKTVSTEMSDKIYFIGQLFGLAIKLKLQINIELNPFLLYQLTHDLDIYELNEIQIKNIIKDYDKNLLKIPPYICYNLESYNEPGIAYCKYNSEGKLIDTTNYVEETTRKIIISLEESAQTTNYFVRGFREQINIETSQIDKLQLKTLNVLISGIKELDFDIFKSHLKFINFNNSQKEILLKIIEDHIKKNNEKEYLQALLETMTASPKIPPLGYSVDHPLRFEISTSLGERQTDIHACFNQFIINEILFESYDGTETSDLYKLFSIELLKSMVKDFCSV